MDRNGAHEAATIIFHQLGGYNLITMIGAYNIMFGMDSKQQPYLAFKIKAKSPKGFNYAKITLDIMDWYTLELGHFEKNNPSSFQTITKLDEIYADALAETFRNVTGLETRMPKIILED